jgi:hypothetical protein
MSALADRIDLIRKIAEEYGVELTGDFPGDPDTALRRWANRLGIPARVALDLESDEEAVWRAAGRARYMRFLEERGQEVPHTSRESLLRYGEHRRKKEREAARREKKGKPSA